MPQTLSTYRFNPQAYLKPLYPEKSKPRGVNLAPNTTFYAGDVLLPVSAAANDVQTITAPGSGTYTLTGVNPLTGAAFTTSALAFGANDAAVAAAIVAALATSSANIAVASLAVTFQGIFAATPVPLMTASAGSVAHTTTGATAGSYTRYAAAGSGTPTCLNVYPGTTDAYGNFALASQAGGSYVTGSSQSYGMAYFGGTFACADLTGMDTNAATKLGRLSSGSVSTGILEVVGF